ncbi:MAG: transglutaminase-like domain-containing protein [Myxococcota bacterium]|nr:transglutaminase-like domain-containing protein [Myxococcota bacterium]
MRRGRQRVWLPFLFVVVAGSALEPSAAGAPGPVLHEPVVPDAKEDLALHVQLEGDLPAALETPSGVVSAPDPRRPPSPSDTTYAGGGGDDTFTADRDTRRPRVDRYEDPFTPSTAPFKRLESFDAVRRDYRLYVRDARLVQIVPVASAGPDADRFYADMIVEVASGRSTRIPSVGPGARIVRKHLTAGHDGDVDGSLRVMRDGADNWFLQGPGIRQPLRGRLVMELAIDRASFGGPLADPAWSDLPFVAPLPENVAREADAVRSAIGVTRALRPRDAIAKLVRYFREFSDSNEPPHGRGSIYLDLALSKKGVCRHRAFAFLVTALSLGVPTRLVLNEAHAWVEVHDGVLWRRIDLGGAGELTGARASATMADAPPYQPAPDPFAWPRGADRGDELGAEARAQATPNHAGSPGAVPSAGASSTGVGPERAPSPENEGRPASVVTLLVADGDVHRSAALRVRGDVRADGEGCAYVPVEILLRDPKGPALFNLGTLATGADGAFTGNIFVPIATPLGDYDVIARSVGDARCGPGETK